MTNLIETIINEIISETNPLIKQNETVNQIEHEFRKHKFYTTREYLIFKIKDKSSRAGRIDLVVREGKSRIAV